VKPKAKAHEGKAAVKVKKKTKPAKEVAKKKVKTIVKTTADGVTARVKKAKARKPTRKKV
jgi:hypothetical protein